MSTATTPEVKVVSREEWLAARRELLAKEKAATKANDALAAERRKLPLVEVTKQYSFTGPRGPSSLVDLFDGLPQLMVYHFMFDADPPPAGKSGAPWEEGCPGCSFAADNVPHLAHLRARGTSFVLVSRAPWAKIAPFQQRMGWGHIPWYSSFGSDFNYDFHVTLDPERGSTEWNFRSAEELTADGKIPSTKGELPGLSVFLRDGDRVLHSYTSYARGLEPLITTYHLLDLTPLGRGEGWNGMPDYQGQGHNWLRHHDKYEDQQAKTCCH